MAQGFYSLEEAAQVLGISTDDLNRMAQRREVRAFADRGTWRFRTQDIDDLAGQGRKTKQAGAVRQPTQAKPAGEMELFDYELSTAGEELSADLASGEAPMALVEGPAPEPAAPPPAPADPEPYALAPEAPAPSGGAGTGDLDVGDLDFKRLDLDLDAAGSASVPLDQSNSEFELSADSSGAPPPAPAKSSSKLAPPVTEAPKSGARLVPLPEDEVQLDFESASTLDDSMVSILGPQGEPEAPPRPPTGMGPAPIAEDALTEEVDLGGALLAGSDANKPKTRILTQQSKAGIGKTQAPPGPVPTGISPNPTAPTPSKLGQPPTGSSLKLGQSKIPGSSSKLAPQTPGSSVKLGQPSASKLSKPPSSGKGPSSSKLAGPKSGSKSKLPPPGPLPSASPFELSDADLQLDLDAGGTTSPVDQSEFELSLAPGGDEPSPLGLGDDEDIDLGMEQRAPGDSSGRAALSGINLHDPADSGISLEKGEEGSEDDFEVSLDADDTGPPKRTVSAGKVDSSDFELTIDDSGSLSQAGKSGSRKKLSSFDASGSQPVQIDEEDESFPSGSQAIQLDEGLEASGGSLSGSEQKDIFETDFDLPALEEESGAKVEEESGSDAVPLEELDTDLESSDFDLSMDELAAAGLSEEEEEPSGSVVVALDEGDESTDVGPPTRRRTVAQAAAGLDSAEIEEVDELLGEDELAVSEPQGEELGDEEIAPPAPAAAQSDWGVFPIIMMLPCVLVMIVAFLMGYELVHGMQGYHQAAKHPGGVLVRHLADLFGEMPKE